MTKYKSNSLKVTLYFKDGTVLKEAYIQCGQLMLNGETVEEIEEILKTSKMVDFTTNYVQGKFIPVNVETYHIKPKLDSDKEIEEYVRDTNFYNSTENLTQYIKSHERTLRKLLNDIN